jgi:dolichol-phosphate mannosyltransferase
MANGARVAEVPIQYKQRIGKKKLKPWHGASIASKMISLAYRLNPTSPSPSPPPQPPPPAPQKPEEPPPTALERAAQGLVIAFTVLLATAAYYLGVSDANTANKLAHWAYYALAGAVLAVLADMAIHRGP